MKVLQVDRLLQPGEKFEAQFEQAHVKQWIACAGLCAMQRGVPDAHGEMTKIELEAADFDSAADGILDRRYDFLPDEVFEP